MTEGSDAASPRAWARTAGLFYLTTFAGALFAEYYVRSSLLVRDDAAATAANILASEQLYRFALAADVVAIAAYVGVTAMLFRLLLPVGRNLSLLAAFLSIAGVAVGAISLVCHIAPLILLADKSYLAVFTVEQLQALSLVFVKLHGQAFTVGMVFFGFYCILIGTLIMRSTFLPRLIGALLFAGGLGYLVDVFATFIRPEFADQLYPYTYMPGFAGEASLALWLALVGANAAKWRKQAGVAGGRPLNADGAGR